MLSELLLKQLNEFRLKGLHCDLVVIADDATSYQLHQLVFIALNRRHFQMNLQRAELKEDLVTHKKMYMHLSSLTAMELKLVIEFWYGSKTGKKNEYDMLVEALKKLDMMYLLEEAGEFILEDDSVSIKKEIENLSVDDNSALSYETPEQTQNVCEHGADVEGWNVEKNSVTDQSYIALDSAEIKQEPVSPKSSEYRSNNSNSAEAEMCLNVTTDIETTTGVDTITDPENQVDVNEIVNSVLVTCMISKTGRSLTEVEAELNLDTENFSHVEMYDEIKAESCTSLSTDMPSKDESFKQNVTNHSNTSDILVLKRTAKNSESLQGKCSIQTDNLVASPTKLRQLLPKPVVYVSPGPKPIAYLCHEPTYTCTKRPSSLLRTAVISRNILPAPVTSGSSVHLDKNLSPLTSSVVSTSKLNSGNESLSSVVSVVSTTEPIKIQPYLGECQRLTSHTNSVLHPRVISVSNSGDLTLATTKMSPNLKTTALHTSVSPLLNTTVSHVLKASVSPVLNTSASSVLNRKASPVSTTTAPLKGTKVSSVPNTAAPFEENCVASFEVTSTSSQVEANTYFTGSKNVAKLPLDTTNSVAREPSAMLLSASKRNANTTETVRNKLKRKPLFKKSKTVEIKCFKENSLLRQISEKATKNTEPHLPLVFEKEDGSECNDLEETEVLVESSAAFLKISAPAVVKQENDDSHTAWTVSTKENKEITSNKEVDESSIFSSECKLEECFNECAYDSDKPLESQSQKCIIPSSEILTFTLEQILAAKKKKEMEKSSENNSEICALNKNGGTVAVSESCVVNKEVSNFLTCSETISGICPLNENEGNVTVSESCVVNKEVCSSIKAAINKQQKLLTSSETVSGICPLNENEGTVTVSESCVVNKEVCSSVKAAFIKRQKILNCINSGEQNTSNNSFNDFITPADAASKRCIIPLSEICTLSPDDIRAAKRQKTYTIEGVSKNLNMNDSLPKSTSEKQKDNDLQEQSTGSCLEKDSSSFMPEGTESGAHRKGIAPRVYVVSKVVPNAVTKNKGTGKSEGKPSADIKNKETSGSENLNVSESLVSDKEKDIHAIKAEAEETEIIHGFDRIPDQEKNIKHQKDLEEALSKERQAMHDIYGNETESSGQTEVDTCQPEILRVQMKQVPPSAVEEVMASGELPLERWSIQPKVSQTLMMFPLSEKMTVPSNQATVLVAHKSVFAHALNPQYSTNFIDKKKLGKTEQFEEKRKRHKSLHEGVSVEKQRKIKRLKRSCSQGHMKRYFDKSIINSEEDSSDDETDIPLSMLKERINAAKETLESAIETVSDNNIVNITKNQSEEVEISEESESLCLTATVDWDHNVELEINEIEVPAKPENSKDVTDISDNTYGFCYQNQKFLCKKCLLKGSRMCIHTDIKCYGPVVDLTKTDCQTAGFSLGIPGVIQENRSKTVSISNTTPELKRVLIAPWTGGTRNGDEKVPYSSSKKCDCDNGYCVIDNNSGMCQGSLQRKMNARKNEIKNRKSQLTKERCNFKVKTMQEKLLSGKEERERLKNRKRRMESLKKKKASHAASDTHNAAQQSSNSHEKTQVLSFQCSGSISETHLPHPVILQCFPNETQQIVSNFPLFSGKDSTLSALTRKTNTVTASLEKDCTLIKARPILPKLSSESVSSDMSSVGIRNMSSPVITSEAQMSVPASAASYTWSQQMLFPTVTSSPSVESPVMSTVTASNTRSHSKSSNVALATPVLTSILTSKPLGSVPSPSMLILRTSDQV